jgi:hypothetical protein
MTITVRIAQVKTLEHRSIRTVFPESVALVETVYIEDIQVSGTVDFDLPQIVTVLVVSGGRRIIVKLDDFIGRVSRF